MYNLSVKLGRDVKTAVVGNKTTTKVIGDRRHTTVKYDKIVYLYGQTADAITNAPEKTSLSNDDILAILDSDDGDSLKKIEASTIYDNIIVEDLIGVVDGVNCVFNSSEDIYLILDVTNNGLPDDYTQTNTDEITFDNAPLNIGFDDKLRIKYIRDTIVRTTVIENIVLAQSGWSLVSGLYQYTYTNSLILSTSIVEIIYMNDTIDIAIDAQITSQADASAGQLIIYAKNAPTDDINIEIWVGI
jgi:hypothetical protein